MSSKKIPTAEYIAQYKMESDFRKAFLDAKKMRIKHVSPIQHRAIASMHVTSYLLAQTLLLPLIFIGLLYWLQPLIFNFWRTYIEFWSLRMDLPFNLQATFSETARGPLHALNDGTSSYTPSQNMLTLTTAAVLAGLVFSLRLNKKHLLLKYPLQIICIVQFAAVLYFWMNPVSSPYSISDHSKELMTSGYVILMATPVMLALGYYILNQGLFKKIINTLLIIAFLGIMIPHQVLAHAMFMTHFSILFMPVLYLCFGALFDALVFIALYSWVVSNVTTEATI